MKRRKFLKILGGAGVVMAAGAGGFLTTRQPETALAPWQQAGSLYADPIRHALSYALLAPNPHNRQPWQIKLLNDQAGILYCDLDRRLPATDPFDRQIVIGLGCFLELFSLAARADGYIAQIDLFPDGTTETNSAGRLDNRPVAHLRLEKQSNLVSDPLFPHCLNRHTDRFAYDATKVVPIADQQAIRAAALEPFDEDHANPVAFVTEDPQLQALQTIASDAMIVEANNHDAHMETVNLMRIGKSEVNQNPDGLGLYGPMLDSLHLVGALTREAMADPNGTMFKGGMDPMLEAMADTNAFVWIGTEENDRVSQITAGRSYMRTCLAATKLGLAMHPVSQALQEYADMAEQFDKLHALLGSEEPIRVQMLARIGYGNQGKASPRWPLADKLLT